MGKFSVLLTKMNSNRLTALLTVVIVLLTVGLLSQGSQVQDLTRQQIELSKQIQAASSQEKPQLQYLSSKSFVGPDQEVIAQAITQLTDEFYAALYQKGKDGSGSYSALANSILPLKRSIPPGPFTVMVLIYNRGGGVAHNLHVILEMDRPITAYTVHYPEPSRLLAGGTGTKSLTIEIGRIHAGDVAVVSVTSDQTESDTVILEANLSPVATPAATSQSLAATPDARESALLAEYAEVATRLQYLPYSDSGRSIEPILTRQSLFPRVKYIAAKQPIASINVTSDEGKAEQVSSPFFIFERAAIDVFPTPTDQP